MELYTTLLVVSISCVGLVIIVGIVAAINDSRHKSEFEQMVKRHKDLNDEFQKTLKASKKKDSTKTD